MKAAQSIWRRMLQGLDLVAEPVVAMLSFLGGHRHVRLVEKDFGQFVIEADKASTPAPELVLRLEEGKLVGSQSGTATLNGSRVEAILRSDRFVYRPLDLPARAVDFLDGVVRAQIDRLTPWSVEQAAFGWSTPVDAGAGRVSITVAATANSIIASYVDAFAHSGAFSVKISIRSPGASQAAVIPIFEKNFASEPSVRKARRLLFITLAATSLVAVAATAADSVIASNLQAHQDEIAQQIAARRQALLEARKAPGDPRLLAERQLARRKNEMPSSVIVLEALSRLLPDHTYVTELRIDGAEMRVMGVTQDAPSLIRLLEHSRHFSGATFFAPTTRGPSDSGDRFNIEAHIEPEFATSP